MIRNTIYQDLITARKEHAENKKAILIMLYSKIQLKEKELKVTELNDLDTISIIKNELKQTNETLEGFKKRNDIVNVDIQKYYVSVLEMYLPSQLNESEIKDEIISELNLNFSEYKSSGELMKIIMPIFKGRADGKVVKQVVDNLLKEN